MISLDNVTHDLIELIEEETGIRLQAGDLEVLVEKGEVTVSLWGDCIARHSIFDEEHHELDEGEIAIFLWECIRDPEGTIVSAKISVLEEELPDQVEQVKRLLTERGLSYEVIEELVFEIVDAGHFPAMHGMADAEIYTGWPDIHLQVTRLHGHLDVSIALNIYFPEESVDVHELVEMIIEAVEDYDELDEK